ncbi:MAG: GGDEF domain-containing protein [Lachnospiraceae bacterium]
MSEILKNKIIAVCTAYASEETVVEYLLTLHDSAVKHGCKLVIFGTVAGLFKGEPNYEGDCHMFKSIAFSHFDAVISFSEYIKDEEVLKSISEGAKEAGIPCFSIDRHVDGCIDIRMDYVSSFEKLVRHIIVDHGLTKVNFISGVQGNLFSDEREQVYKKVLAENNIPFEEKRLGYGGFWEGPTQKVVDKFLEDEELPEAIICANDVMALVACQKLKERGIRVPEDVIVTGFDNIKRAMWNSPSLTTCKIEFTYLTDTIMDVLAGICSGKEHKQEYFVPYEFVLGESCGCIKMKNRLTPDELFEIYNFNKKHSLYQMDMYEMQTFLAEKESVMQLALTIHSYMFSDGFIIVNNSIPEFGFGSRPETEDSSVLSESMRVLVRKKNNEIEMGHVFLKNEILPSLNVQVSVERPIIIMPLHSPGHNFGYMAYSVNHEPIFFNKLVMFNYALRNALEIFRTQKSLREVNRKIEEANARMAELYIRDPLTMLYNRRGFYNNVNKLMDECISNNWEMFIASIDLDDLKPINDVYGHSEGDNAIKTIANSLLVNSHKYEICARFGGDEFVVAGIAENGAETGTMYVKNVEKYLDNYNRDSDKPYKVRASMGLSVSRPDVHSVIDEFIIRADRIMYENKKNNKQFRSKVRTSSSNLFPDML